MALKVFFYTGLSAVIAFAEPAAAAFSKVETTGRFSVDEIVPDILFELAQTAGTSQGNTGNSAGTSSTSSGTTSSSSTSTDTSTSTSTSTASDTTSETADSAQSTTSERDSPSRVRTNLNSVVTNKIRNDLAAAVAECRLYDPVYRIDCLRQNIDHMLANLPANGDYRRARQILQTASSRLGRIVSKYQDPAAPRLRVKSGANPRFKRNRSYRAVKRSDLNKAMSEARQVIEEARTQLLRSSENSSARLAHYQTIAVAVNSTKVLLRSS